MNIKIIGHFLGLLALLLLTACAGSRMKVTTTTYSPGTVLVLPINDAVPISEYHNDGVGSGKMLQDYIIKAFNDSRFKAIPSKSQNPIDHEKALAESKALNATYYLSLTLGELCDANPNFATPSSSQPDSVYVDEGTLYDVENDIIVWQLEKEAMFLKLNYGSYHSLLEKIAKKVVSSINKNAE